LNTTLKREGKSRRVLAISKSVTALLDNSPIPPFIGSNSWVIAPKNQNGKVIRK
jgi:penicillin amidase